MYIFAVILATWIVLGLLAAAAAIALYCHDEGYVTVECVAVFIMLGLIFGPAAAAFMVFAVYSEFKDRIILEKG